jgi:Holliday junction resolvase
MSRRKGANNERGLVAWLRARGRPHIERRLSGGPGDRGDITGWPGVVLEAKSCVRLELAAWIDQLETEIVEAGADTGAVIVKRRGTTDIGAHYAVMTVDRWERLMTEAGR